jgi:hypothetical protein
MTALLLEATIRSTMMAALIGLILTALRVRSGALRHAAWTTVVVGMLVSPLVVLWRPALPVAVPHVPVIADVFSTFPEDTTLPAPASTAAPDPSRIPVASPSVLPASPVAPPRVPAAVPSSGGWNLDRRNGGFDRLPRRRALDDAPAQSRVSSGRPLAAAGAGQRPG